jgi:glutamyl-tRNA reductase
LSGIELYTIDDLRPVVERTLTQRSAELPAAYSIIRAEVARFTRWLTHRQTTASLRSLTTELEQARAAALKHALGQLPPLSPNDRELLDAMTRNLTRTVLQRVGEPRGSQHDTSTDPM